jgi:hypothetical protein
MLGVRDTFVRLCIIMPACSMHILLLCLSYFFSISFAVSVSGYIYASLSYISLPFSYPCDSPYLSCLHVFLCWLPFSQLYNLIAKVVSLIPDSSSILDRLVTHWISVECTSTFPALQKRQFAALDLACKCTRS